MSYSEEQEWYSMEQSFLVFLITIDALRISNKLRYQLIASSASSDQITNFLDKYRRKFKRRPKGVRLL